MARKERTIAEELQIVGLSSTHTLTEIAEIVGVSRTTVNDVRRKYHVVARFGRQHVATRRWAYDETEWAEKVNDMYYVKGMTITAIASQLGLNPNTVTRRMEHLGLRRRRPLRRSDGWKTPDLPPLVGMKETLAILGVTKATMYKWLRPHSGTYGDQKTYMIEPKRIDAGPIWAREDIEEWAAGRRRGSR